MELTIEYPIEQPMILTRLCKPFDPLLRSLVLSSVFTWSAAM